MKTKYQELCEVVRNDAINDLPLKYKRAEDLAPYMVINTFGAVGFGIDGHLYYRRFTPTLRYQAATYIEESNESLIDFLLWASRFNNGYYSENNMSRLTIDKSIEYASLAYHNYFTQGASSEVSVELYKLIEKACGNVDVYNIFFLEPDVQHAILRSVMITHSNYVPAHVQYAAVKYAEELLYYITGYISAHKLVMFEDGGNAVRKFTSNYIRKYPVSHND